MKILLILAAIATAKAGPLPQGLPLGFEYQNIKSSPCGSSSLNINSGFSSTLAPESNSAFVTSTPSPLGFNSELVSSTLGENSFGSIISSTPQTPIVSSTLNAEDISNQYYSSTPAPVILNQKLNSFLVPSIPTNPIDLSQFSSGNGQFINVVDSNSLSNGYSQGIPVGLGDFSSVTVQSTTSGGSLNEAFGIPEDVIETQSQKPEISKNVFFFAAPEEPEPIRPRIHFEQNKKNVNLVFIKAPVAPSLGTIEITPPRQESAEKTVVYVLVKKPEDQQNILVKSAPPVKPNKPDVFFIKYKNEEEAQDTISKVQAQNANLENQQAGQELTLPGELFNVESAKHSVPSQPIENYISSEALLQQTFTPTISSSTESILSTLGNGITQVAPVQVPVNSFSNLGTNFGINNVPPFLYSTPRPQVEINAISNNENLDNFISIGGRPSGPDFVSSTISPFVESSSISSTVSPFESSSISSTVSPFESSSTSPCASSSQLPYSISTTARPSLLGLNPFFKKK